MDDRNEKVSDSVERDIQGAVKMGADAARTAKTLGKAAAHAAAGDVAGAAAEVVKDPETLKKILLILLIPVISFVLITTMFLYALPISITRVYRLILRILKSSGNLTSTALTKAPLWPESRQR